MAKNTLYIMDNNIGYFENMRIENLNWHIYPNIGTLYIMGDEPIRDYAEGKIYNKEILSTVRPSCIKRNNFFWDKREYVLGWHTLKETKPVDIETNFWIVKDERIIK